MEWIAVSRVGKYAQGNITAEMLTEMANSYSPDFMAAPFIREHRKFNDNGVMENNPRALAWVSQVSADNEFLYVMVEGDQENDLDFVYDGLDYRYASIEIEVVQMEDKSETLYLAAVAVTNFPAAKIPQIKPVKQFSQKQAGAVLATPYQKMTSKTKSTNLENTMKPEQLKQLAKKLGLKETATADEVIQKYTEIQNKLKENEDLKQYAESIGSLIEVIKAEPADAKTQQTSSGGGEQNHPPNDQITQLNNKVEEVLNQFKEMKNKTLEQEVDQAIADEKILPSLRDHYLKHYDGNVEGFREYASKLPKMQLNQQITIPKKNDGNPITYNDLLKDPQKFNEMQANNPQLVQQLRSEWLNNPSAQKSQNNQGDK